MKEYRYEVIVVRPDAPTCGATPPTRRLAVEVAVALAAYHDASWWEVIDLNTDEIVASPENHAPRAT